MSEKFGKFPKFRKYSFKYFQDFRSSANEKKKSQKFTRKLQTRNCMDFYKLAKFLALFFPKKSFTIMRN